MVRTQIQLPDQLYRDLKRLAEEREWSLAEALRRGAELLLQSYPDVRAPRDEWRLPDPMRDDPDTVLSELVLVELYVLLRSPSVVSPPLAAPTAAGVVRQLRRHPAWRLVDHVPEVMDEVWRQAATEGFARRRVFDVRLAAGLVRRGVTRFATRNVRDFEGLGFDEVFDPIGG